MSRHLDKVQHGYVRALWWALGRLQHIRSPRSRPVATTSMSPSTMSMLRPAPPVITLRFGVGCSRRCFVLCHSWELSGTIRTRRKRRARSLSARRRRPVRATGWPPGGMAEGASEHAPRPLL